jgi:hypothetical protein
VWALITPAVSVEPGAAEEVLADYLLQERTSLITSQKLGRRIPVVVVEEGPATAVLREQQ